MKKMEMLTATNMETILPAPHRTQGDGMEHVADAQTKMESLTLSTSKPAKRSLVDDFLYRPSDVSQRSLPAPVISGTMVSMTANKITHSKKDKLSYSGFKSKEPKFVPYEPYKAAVKPIIPVAKHKGSRKRLSISSISSSNDLSKEATETCSTTEETSEPTTEIAKPSSVASREEVMGATCNKEFVEERRVMESEIRQLKEENNQLETQLKFQAQVNGELKKLLVAAVGEDLETRVNHLTEDKVQLARALLSSAQRLSTHQEQTEWLAGQCEVWRSKFLASSIMVEELARWKAALSQKAMDLQEALHRLLEERSTVRCSLLDSHRKLTVLRDNFDIVAAVSGMGSSVRKDLPTANVVDLAAANHRLCDVVTIQLLGSALNKQLKPPQDFKNLDPQTTAEKTAVQLLQQPVSALLAGGPDAACTAVMGAAVALGGSKLFPHQSHFACCAHCSGEVKQL